MPRKKTKLPPVPGEMLEQVTLERYMLVDTLEDAIAGASGGKNKFTSFHGLSSAQSLHPMYPERCIVKVTQVTTVVCLECIEGPLEEEE